MLKCIAIDDEPVALSILENFCQRDGGVEIKLYSDPVEGLDAVKTELPDLVFLDIEMNGVSGIDVAKTLPDGICLVFTTAYSQFALDGFELNAVDFLHKPFSFARFQTSLGKVRETIRLHKLDSIKSEGAGGDITVKSEYRNVNISLGDILYIAAMDNYVKICFRDRDPLLSQMSMKELEERLPRESFVRIHKSYIVPVKNVSEYSKRQVTLNYGSVTLPVGRVYADDFIRRISTLTY